MANRPRSECQHAGCTAWAILGSIYCANHQTKDSAGNRERHAPKFRRGPRVKKPAGALWQSSSNPAALDAALADDEMKELLADIPDESAK